MGGGNVPAEILAQLHPLEVKVLPHLKDGISVSALAQAAGMQDVEAMRACQWLENKNALELKVDTHLLLTPDAEARNAVEKGLPEDIFMNFFSVNLKTNNKQELPIKEFQKHFEGNDAFNAALGRLIKRKLVKLENGIVKPAQEFAKYATNKESPEISFLKELVKKSELDYNALSSDRKKVADSFKERKNYLTIKERKDRTISLKDLGKALAKVDVKKLDFADRVTPEDLATGAWQGKTYRTYDVSLNVPFRHYGKIHFVQEAIDSIRRIWLEMGFEEMEGAMVQSAFWDLDALFVPQDHPAREMQDTFYLAHPSKTMIEKAPYERVRDAHERGGGTGSLGWRTQYSRQEAEQLLLRTHTTVLSARTLWAIREGKAKLPGKYFTVGKVFRNEKLDWKHLFEFHQVEGIVVDRNLTFGHLISYLRTFFAKMGFPKIRLRPSHFPYTEPSVEVEVWHPKRQQWIELGGAGMLRPEVTKTLIGEEVPVLAWGLGLERLIVDHFSLDDLRDLYRNDIAQLQGMKHFTRLPW